MARRLALLAMLACAVAAYRPPPYTSDVSESESLDPFALWDDTEESFETTPSPRPRIQKPTKVRLAKVPKVNTTVKNTISADKKKIIRTTTINIESHTNIVVTKRPPVKASKKPNFGSGVQYQWIASSVLPPNRVPDIRQPPVNTRRPSGVKRRPTGRPIRRTVRPTKSTQNKKPSCPPKSSGWLSSFFEDGKIKKTPKKPAKPGWFGGRLRYI